VAPNEAGYPRVRTFANAARSISLIAKY